MSRLSYLKPHISMLSWVIVGTTVVAVMNAAEDPRAWGPYDLWQSHQYMLLLSELAGFLLALFVFWVSRSLDNIYVIVVISYIEYRLERYIRLKNPRI